MLKTLATFELKIGEKLYSLHLPEQCNLGEVHDCLHQMKQFVINKIVELQAAEQPKEAPQVVPETPTQV